MTIVVDDDGPVRVIALNRPEVRNAIDIPSRIELAQAIEAANVDSAVRAVVLTGSDRVFCSGGDIATMKRMSKSEAIRRLQLAQQVIRAIWNTSKPVLAAVEGAAFGAGAALAAACDRVVAAHDARFATTFLNIGLAGDMGTFASLPARIGVARTRQMLMMGQPIDAARALDWGLVDTVCDPGQALHAARVDAAELANRPAEALGAIKSMLMLAPRLHPLDTLDREVTCQAALFDTDDFAEGVAAFQEKRTPHFGAKQGVKP